MHFNFWQENLYNWRWNIKNVNSMTVLFLCTTDDWILLQTLIRFYSSPLPLPGLEFGRKCVKDSDALSICTWFLKNQVWKMDLDKLDFWSISNLNFVGYTDSNNQVRTRPKIRFIQIHFSNLIFQKSSTDQQGDYLVR